MHSSRPKKRQRHLTKTEVYEKTCQILLASTPSQLYQLIKNVQLKIPPLPSSNISLSTISNLAHLHSEQIQTLLFHNLRKLKGYQGLLTFICTKNSPSMPNVPIIILLLATIREKEIFLRDLLDVPLRPDKRIENLANLLSMLIELKLNASLKDLVVAALKSSKHRQPIDYWNATVISRMLQDSQHSSQQYILFISYIQRQLHGIKMSTLKSKSVLQRIEEVVYDGFTSQQVVDHCRLMVEQLTSSYQSIDGQQSTIVIEKRNLLSGFFLICNKAYVRLHTLRKNGDTTIVLLPMSGWCVLGKEIIDDNDDDGGTNDTDAIRLSIVRGRFFTDQINSNFSENDITEMLTALQTTSTNGNIITVTFWDIFYRVACLCDDENDSFRLLWCCADHLDGPCQIVKIQLNNDKNLSLKYFCSMVVSSLNSVATNIASISLKSYSPSFSTTVISKNEQQMSAMSSIRCLTKLIGILSESNVYAWSSLIECGCMRVLNIILLRSKHFNDNGLLNTIIAMYRITQMSIELHSILPTTTEAHCRMYYNTSINLANDISDTMLCRALCRVMKKSSCKIIHECFELLVDNFHLVWKNVEKTNNKNEDFSMNALARSLTRGGIIETMKFLMRKGKVCPKDDKNNGTNKMKKSASSSSSSDYDSDGSLRKILNGKIEFFSSQWVISKIIFRQESVLHQFSTIMFVFFL